MFCCFSNNKVIYNFIADPDDLLTSNINTIYLDHDRYQIIEKKAYIIKKCNKYYNVWNFSIVRKQNYRKYLLVSSSYEKNLWLLVEYNENYISILPTKIPYNCKFRVRKIDYGISNNHEQFFPISLE